MKALALNGPGLTSIVTQEIDDAAEYLAVLRVISSGVCAADSYLWSGNHPWDIKYPIYPGHEIFGEVTKVARDYEARYPIGSRVCVQVIVPCYKCAMCEEEHFNMCLLKRHFGSSFRGSFAEEIVVPHGARLHVYKEPIKDLIGGLSETMANAIYCSQRVNLKGNESVIILGMGSIGACLTQYLSTTYPNLNLAVLTSSEDKRARLMEMSLKAVDLVELQTTKNSYDVMFEMSGDPQIFKAGIASLKPRGIAMIYGVYRSEINFDFNQVSEFKELTLVGGHLADDRAFEASVQYLTSYQHDLGYLISNLVSFDDFDRAFSNPKFNLFKTLFVPERSKAVEYGF